MNLRPRDIVEGSSGGDCASSTKDDGPEIIDHVSVYIWNDQSKTAGEKTLHAWKMNSSAKSKTWNIQKGNSLDIFEEAIRVSFAQWPGNNRRDGANQEEEDKRAYRLSVEDHRQCEINLEHELVSRAFCELASRTNNTPL